MVGHHTHGHIAALILAVAPAGHFGYLTDKRLKDVGIVIALLPLKDHAKPLEAHTRIDMAMRELLEGAVGLAVVLHEDEVPYLDDLRMVAVHQFPSGHGGTLLGGTKVEMNFATRSARARIAHLPEIILLIAAQDTFFGNEPLPIVVRFAVERHTVLFASFEDRDIELFLRKSVYLREQLPRPLDRLLLEVVAEGPVAEHLEHGVMVGIVPHLVEVVVFPRNTQTLLCVGHTRIFRRAVAQKNILELVHARIGKHQCRVILYDHRCRRDDGMLLAPEKFQESFPYLIRFHCKVLNIISRLSVTLLLQQPGQKTLRPRSGKNEVVKLRKFA